MTSSGEERATRDGFGTALLRLGEQDQRIVVVGCDLVEPTRTQAFAEAYPDRFFAVGIAEQNGIGVAAGLALTGLRPFIASFGAFLTGRYDQIRISCAYNEAGVVIVGSHSGLAIGKDGTTQMGLEDLNVMAAVPGMHIYQPADALEMEQIVGYLVGNSELAYLRMSRTPQPAVYAADGDYVFKSGSGHVLREGRDVALVASGDSVYQAVQAAAVLAKQGIEATVVNMATLKPIDRELIARVANEVSAVVTVEDHNIVGGLGSRVCEVVAEEGIGIKVVRLGIPDCFGESGTPADLYRKYELDVKGIAQRVQQIVKERAKVLA